MLPELAKLEEIRLGACSVLPNLGVLIRNGERVPIGNKAFEILLRLIAANGAILTKDDLLSQVWPHEIVGENNLQAQMSALRRALGPDRSLIRTEFGNGYRLESGRANSLQADSVFDLPAKLSPLIGREIELKTLVNAVVPGRLVTVTGAGGIGKTRLAIEAGHKLIPGFYGQACLIELSMLANPDLIASRIASALRIDGAELLRDADRRLLKLNALLILDNCEHYLDEVARSVQFLLANAHGLAILATSQEALEIEGEQIVRLQPLTVPPPHTATLEEAARYSAIELLKLKVGQADMNFKFAEEQVPDLCDICRRLDGIPLAIEFAAARIPLLGTSAVLDGLSDRFKLLSAGRRIALPRHQTLRATLEWSFGLLTEAEQTLIVQLGVFAGPFTLEAVHAVNNPHHDKQDLPKVMASLVSKSLVSAETRGTVTRFRLFESARAFVLEKSAPDRYALLARRHAEFFAVRLRQATYDWSAMSPQDWTKQYSEDLSDVRAALDWMFYEEKDLRAGAALLCASLPFWMQLSLLDECRARVETALSMLEGEALEPSIEMTLQEALGKALSWVHGPTPAARKAWQRTLQLAKLLSDVEHELQAHYGLWLYYLRTGEYADSLKSAEALRKCAISHNDRQAELTAQRIKGVSLHFLGRHKEGVHAVEQTLTQLKDGDRSCLLRFGIDQRVAGLAFLSRMLWIAGDPVRAEEIADNGIEEARGLAHVSSLCCALLEGACPVAALSEDFEKLKRYADEAERLAARYNLGFWRSYAAAYGALASAKTLQDEAAVDRLKAASETFKNNNVDDGYFIFVSELSMLLVQLGRHEEALQNLEQIVPARYRRSHWGEARFLFNRADILAKISGTKNTNACFDEALMIARAQGAKGFESLMRMSG